MKKVKKRQDAPLEHLAKPVAELRAAGGWTMKEFAALLDRDATIVVRWEQNGPSAKVEDLWAFATAAGSIGREDLAEVFRAEALARLHVRLGGLTEKMRLLRVAEELAAIEAIVAKDPGVAPHLLRYARWRQAAHPDDVQRVEQEIKGDLMEG